MADAAQRHWLAGVLSRSGHPSSDSLRIDPAAGTEAAWIHVCRVCGLDMDALATLVSKQLRLPLADLGSADPAARKLLPEGPARELQALPLRSSNHTLVVATADPVDFGVAQKLEFLTGRHTEFEVAAPDALREAIDEHFAPERGGWAVTEEGLEDAVAHVSLPAADLASPLGRLLALLLLRAVQGEAQEIRLEPPERGGRIKLGAGGALRTFARLPRPALAGLVERLRALSDGDGRIAFEVDGAGWELRMDGDADDATLRLLLQDTRTAAAYFPEADVEQAAAGTSGIAAPHALVVDDEADQRLLLRRTLEGAGFVVHEATDGVSALAELEHEEEISLLVLDLMMPHMGGLDVLERVRAAVRTAALPVVVVTGSTDPDDEVRLLAAGADDYIHKPIDPPAVARRVDAVMRRSDLWSFVDE